MTARHVATESPLKFPLMALVTHVDSPSALGQDGDAGQGLPGRKKMRARPQGTGARGRIS